MDCFDTAVEICGMVEIPRWGSDTPAPTVICTDFSG
jgi:hypothetical protein